MKPLGKELDRKDNDKGYRKSNCRWVTRKTQSRNKRNSIFIHYEGKAMTAIQLSKKLGVTPSRVYQMVKMGRFN